MDAEMVHDSYEVLIPEGVEYPTQIDHAQSPASLSMRTPPLRKRAYMC